MYIVYFQVCCGGFCFCIVLCIVSVLIFLVFVVLIYVVDISQLLLVVVVLVLCFFNDLVFLLVVVIVIIVEQICEVGIDNVNEVICKLGGVYGCQSLFGLCDFLLDLCGFGINGDQNMVVLVDGVCIFENELVMLLLLVIFIEIIECIEIVCGGSSVLYGSGVIGGIIQIIMCCLQVNNVCGIVIGEVGSNGQCVGWVVVLCGWDNMFIDVSYVKLYVDNWCDNSKFNQENFSIMVQWFVSDWCFGLCVNLLCVDFGLLGSLSQV